MNSVSNAQIMVGCGVFYLLAVVVSYSIVVSKAMAEHRQKGQTIGIREAVRKEASTLLLVATIGFLTTFLFWMPMFLAVFGGQ